MFSFGPTAQVFLEEAHHQALERDGFVIAPLLDPAQLEALRRLYAEVYPELPRPFYATTFHPDPSHRATVHQRIHALIEPSLDRLFGSRRVHFCSFIAKAASEDSALKLHQDMTLVDESRFNGINVWCPLIDLDASNGPLLVLPGSHRITPTYRTANLPDIYDGLEEAVMARMVPLHLAAGEAVIFDQSIMHASPPNRSADPRPVINAFVTHPDCGIQICWGDREAHPGRVELFAQGPDFVQDFQKFGDNIRERPNIGESLGWVDHDFRALTLEELEARYPVGRGGG